VQLRFAAERDADFAELAAALRRRWPAGPAAFDRVLWHGGLHLDGRPVDPDRPPRRVAAGTRVAAWGFAREPEEVPLGRDAVLLDARGVVAAAKPAWLPTQATRASRRLGLEARLRALLGCPGLVAAHRLDRATSGVVLFARDAAAAAWLGRELREGRVARRYLAWVAPVPAWSETVVRGFLARAAHPARIRFALHDAPRPGARASETHLRRIAVCGERALLEAHPRTGRTHQIRVHCAAAGHPVVGVDLYGPAWAPGRPSAAGRALLHARELRFRLPGGEERAVRAPLPADFPSG
jgi:23S rRNA pseudouridine1911/1915/1917 synthase